MIRLRRGLPISSCPREALLRRLNRRKQQGDTTQEDAAALEGPPHPRSAARTELLWKEYFRDPSQFWDKRDRKTGPRSPDFKHKVTKELLWINGRYNPSWVQVELRRKGDLSADTSAREEHYNSDEYGIHNRSLPDSAEDPATLCYQKCQGYAKRHILMGLLKACAQRKDLQTGTRVHDDAVRKGLLENDELAGGAVVSMYCKCGAVPKAQEVFDNLPLRNVVSWNALITGYTLNRRINDVLDLFRQMQVEGVCPDAVTFVSILKACGGLGAVGAGQAIHASIVTGGLMENDIFVGNALVDMYAKCGLPAKAQEVFDSLPLRDVITWSMLIAGYVQDGRGEEALSLFEQMQLQGISPDAVTYASAIKACTSAGAIDKGQDLHADVARKGLLEKDIYIGTALVDMYAKYGLLAKAQEVFDKLPDRDVVVWSALITGYAQCGETENLFKTFENMLKEGIKPNLVMLTSLLNACMHAGLLEKAQMYFLNISREYGINLTVEH